MRRLALTVSAALALPMVACAPPSEDDAPVDLRRTFPEAPAQGFALRTPEYVIPAGSERQFCWITTYEGEDVGITATYNYQTVLGHHVTLFGTSALERDFPDGTSWDCTDTEALDMASMEPVIIGGSISATEEGVLNAFELPEGMAAPLERGQRMIVQSHYVNTRPEPVLVQDEAQFATVPEDDVQVWAAPLVATVTDFTIPAHSEEYVVEFDCDYDASYELLYLGGHLHEWGKSFRATHTRGGVSEVVYEVAEWDPVLRDAPAYVNFAPGEFVLAPDDTLTTRCEWSNDEDEALEFPQEMCVTFGMAYPSRVPIICSGP
jgi:hypothetical protein